MKTTKSKITMLAIIWFITLVVLIVYQYTDNGVDRTSFVKDVSVREKEDKVGAKIWLKEAIHGTEGITYRYIIKTDCPKWDFESRYMSSTPLAWVDGETSAVEVLIYDTQMRYNGTVYASGTYYTVPLLDGVASENITFEEWKQKLIKQAYQTYASEPKQTIFSKILKCILILIPVILLGIVVKKLLDKLDVKTYEISEMYEIDTYGTVRTPSEKPTEKRGG